jgi:hypothetical protein
MFGEQFNERATADGWTMRNAQFKLIHFYDHIEMLFDLSTDPYEFTNLLATALTPTAQANLNSLRILAVNCLTLPNTAYTRNLLPYPNGGLIGGVGFSNGAASVNVQFTQLSTNGSFANPNQTNLTQFSGTNLNYDLFLWRSSNLADALSWVPVATNLVMGITNNFLLSTSGVLTDSSPNASSYFYQVTPYVP